MPSNPIKTRPTASIGAVTTLAGAIVAYLVSNGYIPAEVMKRWGWLIVLGALGLAFLLVWFNVTPEAKVGELRAQLEDGKIPDVDVTRLLAGVEDIVHAYVSQLAATPLPGPLEAHAIGDAHPDATAVGAPERDTLSAGSPE